MNITSIEIDDIKYIPDYNNTLCVHCDIKQEECDKYAKAHDSLLCNIFPKGCSIKKDKLCV